MKKIKIVGVIGAGTMGSALAQKFTQEGFKVVLVDRSMSLVEQGLLNIGITLEDGKQRGVFTKEQVLHFLANIYESDNLEDLKYCDLIVEAIYENFEAKKELFEFLVSFITKECIIATNTSSFSVTELSKYISLPERFIGMHFFYHAAKNRLVEIIPGKMTSKQTLETCKFFVTLIGKDPVECKDTYGFAVNRFFVPWLNESVRIVEEKIATAAEVDKVCMNVFGISMGPFSLMNATGIPIAYHSEKTLEVFGRLYDAAPLLKKQAETDKLWEITMESSLDINPEKEQSIRERMLGVVFFVSSQILDEEVCSATHLNRAAKIGLRWKKGPIELMKSSGGEEVNRMIELISKKYEMKKPVCIGEQYWKMHTVNLEINSTSAIITMDQPENMNALSEETVQELFAKFCIAEKNPLIKTIFITGSGKAFVAGADIKFFVKNIKSHKIADIELFTRFSQKVFNHIDKSAKNVVMIINGLTLGGGLELALCADRILAFPSAVFAFPETGIGIYPALGGTQRTAIKIGKGLSKYLIHTGKMLSATEAEEIGLVDKVITKEEGFLILHGDQPLPSISHKSLRGNWIPIKDFFEKNTLVDIQNKSFNLKSLPTEELTRIVKSISYKAPIAIKIADKLIDDAKGCDSELTYLNEIFSTSDALIGLTSIGQKVQYLGK